MVLDDAEARRLSVGQLRQADNMTDALSALTALANFDCPERKPALEQFYTKWKDEPLVVDKWLAPRRCRAFPARSRGFAS